MTKKEYFETAKFIWKTYVPKSGQADTVQGELLRAVEKLRDEAQRNGNINWDEGHEILAHYIETILGDWEEFTPAEVAEIKADVARLVDFEHPYTEDDIYDRLTARIVQWYLKNPDPIPHIYNHYLKR
jgi:hypothetical protein